jgi:hypothetical protein
VLTALKVTSLVRLGRLGLPVPVVRAPAVPTPTDQDPTVPDGVGEALG